MMILTIDNKHNDIKLTSLARDSYVDIPGHGKQNLLMLMLMDKLIY